MARQPVPRSIRPPVRPVAWSTVRYVLRPAAAAFCLLSLLAFLAMAWLWWHGRRVVRDEMEIACRGVLVAGYSDRDGIDLLIVRGWPGGGAARARAFRGYEDAQTDMGYYLAPSDA